MPYLCYLNGLIMSCSISELYEAAVYFGVSVGVYSEDGYCYVTLACSWVFAMY